MQYLVPALLLLTLFPACKEEAPPGPPAAAMEFYEGREAFERPVTVAGSVPGIPNVRAETCGACHQEIYAEWAISTHARAWKDDAQFQAELHKSRGKDDPESNGDVGWLCVNCHTPAVEQLPQLVVGLHGGDIGRPIYVDNPTFDPAMQDEAIGCASCHVEDGVVYGPWGNSDAPHPVAKRESLLDERVCVRCHQAEQFYVSRNLGCFFDTGKTWAASPSGQAGESCQSCHMPEVRRPVVENYPERETRRHWFGGSLIPKKPEFADELQPLESVFGDGVTIRLEPFEMRHRLRQQLQSELAAPDRAMQDEKTIECTGDCLKYAVEVTNTRAGHSMPTGDPERHIDVVATATKNGDVVARAWTRIGSRYQWWPRTILLANTRLLPGESRVIPIGAPAGSTIEVVATKYRMYLDAFEHHELEGEYVRGREFFRATYPTSSEADGT